MASLKYYPLDGGCFNSWSSQTFGAWPKLVEDLAGEDGDEDRYALVEMFKGDEASIEAVTCDGNVIGTLNAEPPADLEEYETFEQMELREGEEDAARELNAAARQMESA